MAEGPIEHVVVLMLENRSFDSMLGFLDHPSPVFPRLERGSYANRVNPGDPASEGVGVTPDAGYVIALDPPHSHQSAMEQLNVSPIGRPRMNGFIAAYNRKASGKEPMAVIHWARLAALVAVGAVIPAALWARFGGRLRRLWPVVWLKLTGLGWFGLWRAKTTMIDVEPQQVGPEVMRAMTPDKIPVLATLAKEFAVCTRWHCSVPGETWPNRNFMHAATSEDAVDIEIGFYEAPTVFELLERHGATWRVYHDGNAQLWAFWRLWRDRNRCARWHGIDAFDKHVAADDLPAYSFIEPDHDGRDSNSQHPNNNTPAKGGGDFVRGEELVARVYNALRDQPDVFAKTLLVVTYDEHGGMFDHVPPPTRVAAPAPLGKRIPILRRLLSLFVERGKTHFRFRMLGPRVPTVLVSPRIPRGTVDPRLYDHSSVVTTLRRLFAPGAAPLTARDAAANSFEHVASLAEPRPADDLPEVVPPPVPPAPAAAVAAQAAGAPGLPHPAVEADEFTRQLGALARQVGEQLDADGELGPAPHLALAADGAGPPGSQGAGEGVLERFRQAAQRARR